MPKCPCQDAQQKAVVPSDVVASTLTLQLRTRYVTTSKCPFLAALNAWQRDYLECGEEIHTCNYCFRRSQRRLVSYQ